MWRDKRRAPAAVAILIGIVGASYGAAAWLTGWSRYADALREHSAYITATDSFHSPTRPPPWRLAGYFLLPPSRAPLLNVVVTLFAVIGLSRPKRATLLALAAFAPFTLIAILYLDHFSASRFSIGYAPLIALLAADGIALVARRAELFVAGALV